MHGSLPVVALLLAAGASCAGADANSDLTDIKTEPAGSNCPGGGVVLTKGSDVNQDGLLNPSEIQQTNYVCSGSGSGGVSTLSNVTSEPAGTNCPAGGFRIENGADTNNDHTLQASEVTSISYVCGAGAAQLVKVAQPLTVVNANTGAAVTILQAQITTSSGGRLLAIGEADAYCSQTTCPAGNPAASGFMWLSTLNTETDPAADHSYFHLTPNTTESISRTQDFTIAAAGTRTLYLRGEDEISNFAFFRPSITLVFLP